MQCEKCLKKLRLGAEIPCKCGKFYCPLHRCPQYHDCKFDYQKEHREKLKTKLVKCEASCLEVEIK